MNLSMVNQYKIKQEVRGCFHQFKFFPHGMMTIIIISDLDESAKEQQHTALDYLLLRIIAP